MAKMKSVEWILCAIDEEISASRAEADKDIDSNHSRVNNIIRLMPSKQALASNVGITLTRKQNHTVKRRKRDMAKVYPDKRPTDGDDFKELRDHGIHVRDLEDEEEKWKTIQMVRMLPCSLATKRRFRAKLSEANVKQLQGYAGWKHRRKLDWKRFKIWRKEMAARLELWGGALKKVEGHQGTGVVSYFVFLRTLFILNLVIFSLVFIFMTLPPLIWPATSGYPYHVTGESVAGVSTTNTAYCSSNYSVTVSSDAGTVIQDFLQGTGWMEQTALFYGWYYPSDLDLAPSGSSAVINYTVPLAYFLTAVVVLLISLSVMARSTGKSFKEQLSQRTNTGNMKYGPKIFCAWDYALHEENPVAGKQRTIYKDIVAEIAEDKFQKQRQNMTGGEKCKLYTIRFLINFLILAMLGGSGYLIYFVQDFSTGYTTSDGFLELIVQYLPAITLGLLNGILPIIFEVLVGFENYTPAFVIKIHLARIVFLKLASLAILVITMYSLITCTKSAKDTTCNVNTGDCTELKCWETYVGQSFYKLTVSDFLVPFVVTFGVEFPRKLITTKCENKLLQKVGPAVFDVPKSVLELIFTQMLCWLGFVFAPMVTAIIALSMFCSFYLKYFSAMVSTGPAKVPYKASRSNSFFMVVLIMSFFLSCFPVGYAMVKMTPSKGCGPFRIYDTMSVILTVTVDNFPSWFNTIITTLTSMSAIFIIIVILILMIYFCSIRASANKYTMKMLEEQLMMESRDKQYLMAKLYESTGEKGHISRKRATPPPPPPVYETSHVVNEVEKDSEEIKIEVPARTPTPVVVADGRKSNSPRFEKSGNQGNPTDF